LAGRLVRGTALVVAVGLFAVSYPTIRYTAEAKPYGCDLFLALVMLTLLVEWLHRPEQSRWLWVLAAMIAPTVGFSYPSVFVAGSVSLIVGYSLWRGGRHGWIAWATYNVLLLAAFAVSVHFSGKAVGRENQKFQEDYWVAEAFPPVTQPLKLVPWFFQVHSGSMLAYPGGGPGGGSTVAFLLCIAGTVVLAGRRHGLLAALCFLPLALNFTAAAMHRFPYGSHMRMSLYSAGAFCLLMGLGAAAAVRLHRKWRLPILWNIHPVSVVLVGLAIFAACLGLRDVTHPYKSGTTLRAREFARWFWSDLANDAELVCLETDLKQDLSPGTYQWGWSALYLCNQRIYSPRHARGESPRWDEISAEHPLRCSLFRSAIEERDDRPLAGWLDEMKSRYRLVAHDRYPFPIGDHRDIQTRTVDFIEVFRFVPKGAPAEEGMALRGAKARR
jgi:hypothetical protein